METLKPIPLFDLLTPDEIKAIKMHTDIRNCIIGDVTMKELTEIGLYLLIESHEVDIMYTLGGMDILSTLLLLSIRYEKHIQK